MVARATVSTPFQTYQLGGSLLYKWEWTVRVTTTLRREVVDKILIDIPAVLSLTIQGALVLGMFLLATLLDGMDITLLFAIYIVFWSLQYTTAFRSYLNDRQGARN